LSRFGVSVSQDSSQGSGHHFGGSVGGTSAGQGGPQNADGAISHGQQGGATGSGLDTGQHGGFTGGHGGLGGAPQADTGAQTDTERCATTSPGKRQRLRTAADAVRAAADATGINAGQRDPRLSQLYNYLAELRQLRIRATAPTADRPHATAQRAGAAYV
jgi:hypothetical protein